MTLSFRNPQLLAHQVELSGEVGATLHIEPADNPRAGEPSVTWFALVTQGGRPVPLAACDCTLAVYTLPRQSDDAPVSEPVLSPLSAEGYEAIPSAEITFPAVGEYELLLTGSATGDPAFEPFELSFDVLVARGAQSDPSVETTAEPSAESELPAATSEATESVVEPSTGEPVASEGFSPWPLIGVLLLGAIIGGVAYMALRNKIS